MKELWKKVKVGEIGKVITGKTPKTAKPENYGGSIPFLTPSDDMGVKYVRTTGKTLTECGLAEVKNALLPKNSVCVSCIGSDLGKVVITTEPTVTNQQINSIVVDTEKFDVSFIYYAMIILGKELNFISKTSTAVPIVNKSSFSSYEICCPDIILQRKIAGALSAIDEKIDNNTRINDNLYEMVNAYYTSLFKDVECEMTTIGNYAERIYSGGTPTTSNAAYWDGAFGWFSSGETRNRFVISTEKTITQAGIDNSSTKFAAKHDIVMASAGQGFTRGQTSMLLIDTYVNQSVIVIHAERKVLPYLFWNLANRYEELRAISDSSSIRGSLTTKMIAAFEIPLANEESLQAFADFSWSVIPQIENNLLENERLAALRDALLPKLMSGEIDVSDIQL